MQNNLTVITKENEKLIPHGFYCMELTGKISYLQTPIYNHVTHYDGSKDSELLTETKIIKTELEFPCINTCPYLKYTYNWKRRVDTNVWGQDIEHYFNGLYCELSNDIIIQGAKTCGINSNILIKDVEIIFEHKDGNLDFMRLNDW